MPKISAVMALYNTEYEFLKPTVESILNQNFKDFELIIIDDASQIDYSDFFKNFNDERINYFKLGKNSGPGHARNEGIKKASGEYVAIVDSDDIYLPQRFEIQANFLDKNPEISLISCAFKQSNNGKIPPVVEEHEDIKIFMLFNSAFANPAVMLRQEKFADNNLFYPEDKNFGEDYELWVNAMHANIKMANLKDVLMIYTRRAGQLSKTKSEKQTEILKEIYKKILTRININPTDEELDFHHRIYTQIFADITLEQVSQWFDKIIQNNTDFKIYNEQKLIELKNETIKKVEKFKNRLFKIKIGQKNICLNKNFKIYLEDRD